MIIREATESDVPTIINFQIKMAKETENISLNRPLLTEGVSNLFKDPAKGQYYVAEETQIIGCLMTTYEWSDWRDGTILWIQSVYIQEGFRGKGVYRKMYEHIKNLALSNPGLKGIRLYVDKTNMDARHVYQKMGMNGEHYQVYEWMKS